MTFEIEAWMLWVLGGVLYFLAGILTGRRAYWNCKRNNGSDPELAAFWSFVFWPLVLLWKTFCALISWGNEYNRHRN